MNIDAIESRFYDFLSKAWTLGDVSPFLRSYVRLLLAFRSELSRTELDALLERQNQLADNRPVDSFPEFRAMLRENIDRQLSGNEGGIRERALSRLLFSAFLDSEEPDYFYLVEPMFEFARNMSVDPNLLKDILKTEFPGFTI